MSAVTPIPLTSIASSSRVETRLFSPRANERPLMPLMHANLCDHEKYGRLSDVHILFGERVCHCFRGILEVRLPHVFTSEIVVRKKERKGLVVLEIPSVPYESFSLLLRYAYTGEVPLTSLSIVDKLQLFKAAFKLGAAMLALDVEQHIQSSLSTENIFTFIIESNRLELDSVKAICFNYAAQNYADVVTNKEGISALGIELFQELTCYNEGLKADGSAAKKEESYQSAVIPNKTRKDFESLYRQMPHPDAVAMCVDGRVPFHRCVLAAYSEKFLAKLIYEADAKKLPHSYTFGDVTCGSFRGLLEVAYFGCTNMSARDACGLLATMVLPYSLPAIRGVCELVLEDVDVSNALEILNITYLEANRGRTKMTVELRQRCLSLVQKDFGRMNIECLRDMSPDMAFDLVSALHLSHQELLSIGPSEVEDSVGSFVTSPRPQISPRSPRENMKKKKKSGFFR